MNLPHGKRSCVPVDLDSQLVTWIQFFSSQNSQLIVFGSLKFSASNIINDVLAKRFHQTLTLSDGTVSLVRRVVRNNSSRCGICTFSCRKSSGFGGQEVLMGSSSIVLLISFPNSLIFSSTLFHHNLCHNKQSRRFQTIFEKMTICLQRHESIQF